MIDVKYKDIVRRVISLADNLSAREIFFVEDKPFVIDLHTANQVARITTSSRHINGNYVRKLCIALCHKHKNGKLKKPSLFIDINTMSFDVISIMIQTDDKTIACIKYDESVSTRLMEGRFYKLAIVLEDILSRLINKFDNMLVDRNIELPTGISEYYNVLEERKNRNAN